MTIYIKSIGEKDKFISSQKKTYYLLVAIVTIYY